MSVATVYIPPKVWVWDQESGGKFASINRPVAGATHDRDLPVGRHPLQLYSSRADFGAGFFYGLRRLGKTKPR